MSIPIPRKQESLIKLNECVLFTGSYNTINRNVVGNISTLPCNISINRNGYNIRPAQYYYVNDKDRPNIKFLYETYTISSYNNFDLENKIGEITWNGLYKDTGSDGITSSSIQSFVVLGKSGIFKSVIKVIIDFTNATERIIYFIGRRN
jgi:hypothetical protein